MSFQDTTTKQYMSEPAVFADAFNYLIYGGRPVIRPEQLTDLDATQFALPYGENEQGKPEATQKYRDVLKTLAVKTDDRCTYLVLGIENQSNVHYAMPVRNMLYDALQYEKQVRDLAAQHRKKHDAATAEEYLSGLTREDRLSPVITLVINFGSKCWDGPMSLHEMLTEQPSEVLRYVQDYQMALIDPMTMAESDFERFSSSLREVLSYIRCQKDKERMQKLLEEREQQFRRLERNAAMVIQAMTSTPLKIDQNAEVIDMCEAIQGMMNDKMQQGMQQGRKLGLQQGMQQGRKQGMREANLATALRLMKMGFTAQQIAEATQLPEAEILQLQRNNAQ